MAKEIKLNTGLSVVVDAEDYEWLSMHKWQEGRGGYAQRIATVNGVRSVLKMHRAIMNAPKGVEVDHIDGNPFNNRRSNLRLVTRSQNGQNLRGARSDSKSGVRNVAWDSHRQRYRVYVTVNGQMIRFGSYKLLEEAARVASEARRNLMTHAAESMGGNHE